ncbi:MAG TPA: response regulator [Phycisphaerae bacterium]|nr:response regulator [Phycisphaerae bacterium]
MFELGLRGRFSLFLVLLCGTVGVLSLSLLWLSYGQCAEIVALGARELGPHSILGATTRHLVWTGIVTLAVLLFTVFVGLLVLRHAWMPMEDLVAAAEAIADGDHGRRAEENVPAELAHIARAVNRMAATIAGQSAEAESRIASCRGELLQQVELLQTRLLLEEKAHGDLCAAKAAAESLTEELRSRIAELEEKLAEMQRVAAAAETASLAKSEFLADMSHEIRTPLTAILGFAETLLNPTSTDEERLDAASTIERNGRQLLAVVNDLLVLSRIEAGNLEVSHEVCSLFQVIAEVQSLMHVRAYGKNLTFDVDYVGDIPTTIQTDPVRLRQILCNLMGNAVQYTDVGGVHVVVRFSDTGAEPEIVFEVIDTGRGIAPEVTPNLFTPYWQSADRVRGPHEGAGLGLTISKHLARLLGGDLAVESTPDQGSVFRFAIATGPLDGVEMVDGQENAILIAYGPQPLTATELERGAIKARILLAEDGPDNQRLIARLLRKAGAEVELADDGQVALEHARRAWHEGRPFDLILMDMEMPRVDGYAATSSLRSEGYDRPILALTAHAMAGDRERCVNAGCDDYLTKPVDRVKLIAAIFDWVGKHSCRVPVSCKQA